MNLKELTHEALLEEYAETLMKYTYLLADGGYLDKVESLSLQVDCLRSEIEQRLERLDRAEALIEEYDIRPDC